MTSKPENELRDLILSGDVEAVRAFIAGHRGILKKPFGGLTPWLTIAAQIPHKPAEPDLSAPMVHFLLDRGLDPNQSEMYEGKPRNWPAEVAVVHQNFESLGLLLNHGADPNVGILGIDNEFYALIHLGDVNGARAFAEAHPEVVQRRYRGFLPWLIVAAQGRSVEMVQFLISQGINVNEPRASGGDPDGWPLSVAADNGALEIVRVLLEHGADPNVDRVVIGAITGAPSHSLEIVQLLQRHGADLHRVFSNELIDEPMNALSEAINWGKEDVADYLRSQGCVLPGTASSDEAAVLAADETVAYFDNHFGPVQRATIFEIVPTEPRITVHVIPPSSKHRLITLFTTGMASRPMAVPDGQEDFRYGEVFIQLPIDWRYTDLHDPAHGWPIVWLRSMAQYSYRTKSWLGPVSIIANEDPPEPLGPGVPFTSWMLFAEHRYTSQEGRTVQLYRMVPLHTAERALATRKGTGPLLRALEKQNVSFVVDVKRPSVV